MIANLVVECGPVKPGTGLMWVAPASVDVPEPDPNLALPHAYSDAGLIDVPELIGDTFRGGRLTGRCLEINPVVLDLHHHGGQRHIVIDIIDGDHRIRWRLDNATIHGAGIDTPDGSVEWPVQTSALAEAVWVLQVDVDDRDVTRVAVPLGG